MDKSWKRMERKVAKKLGGQRIPCSGISGGRLAGDVLHDKFFIECKYGQQIPKRIIEWFRKAKEQNKEGKITLLVLKPKGMHDEFVLLSLKDFVEVINGKI